MGIGSPSPMPTSSLPAQPVQRARGRRYLGHGSFFQSDDRILFFARNFCLDSNLKFSIYFFLTAWHDVKQNNCNRDPQIANNNKKGVSSCVINFQAFLVSAVANRDVAIQNWWHF